MSKITFENFKKKAFADSEVKKEYDSLTPAYELRKRLIRDRKSVV